MLGGHSSGGKGGGGRGGGLEVKGEGGEKGKRRCGVSEFRGWVGAGVFDKER